MSSLILFLYPLIEGVYNDIVLIVTENIKLQSDLHKVEDVSDYKCSYT